MVKFMQEKRIGIMACIAGYLCKLVGMRVVGFMASFARGSCSPVLDRFVAGRIRNRFVAIQTGCILMIARQQKTGRIMIEGGTKVPGFCRMTGLTCGYACTVGKLVGMRIVILMTGGAGLVFKMENRLGVGIPVAGTAWRCHMGTGQAKVGCVIVPFQIEAGREPPVVSMAVITHRTAI
jgi:hypothetical protein